MQREPSRFVECGVQGSSLGGLWDGAGGGGGHLELLQWEGRQRERVSRRIGEGDDVLALSLADLHDEVALLEEVVSHGCVGIVKWDQGLKTGDMSRQADERAFVSAMRRVPTRSTPAFPPAPGRRLRGPFVRRERPARHAEAGPLNMHPPKARRATCPTTHTAQTAAQTKSSQQVHDDRRIHPFCSAAIQGRFQHIQERRSEGGRVMPA